MLRVEAREGLWGIDFLSGHCVFDGVADLFFISANGAGIGDDVEAVFNGPISVGVGVVSVDASYE